MAQPAAASAARPPPDAAAPRLVADIGGTNARFGWVDPAGDSSVQHVRTLAVASYPGPGEAARDYLAALAAQLGPAYRPPRQAAWAMATAVTGDRVALLNGSWDFSRSAVRDGLGLDRLLVLNDFEALALALPTLRPGQLREHAGWPPRAAAAGVAMAVIGPGTGLGVAGVVPVPCGGWAAVPGEGGHATLAAGDDEEAALLHHVRRSHAHVSAERLLSGIGLPLLHAAVAAQAGGGPPPAATTRQIVAGGVDGSDALCRRTLEVFCALLGGFAGNVALTLGARGGVYIGGGIVPRMADVFFASHFRERFEAKGRLRDYLASVPTLLITDTLAALGGAAAALE